MSMDEVPISRHNSCNAALKLITMIEVREVMDDVLTNKLGEMSQELKAHWLTELHREVGSLKGVLEKSSSWGLNLQRPPIRTRDVSQDTVSDVEDLGPSPLPSATQDMHKGSKGRGELCASLSPSSGLSPLPNAVDEVVDLSQLGETWAKAPTCGEHSASVVSVIPDGGGPAASWPLTTSRRSEATEEEEEDDDDLSPTTETGLRRPSLRQRMKQRFGVQKGGAKPKKISKARASWVKSTSSQWHDAVARMVLSQNFDWAISALIILNAISLGVQTDYAARTHSEEVPPVLRVVEIVFCIIFSAEIAVRLYVFRANFFIMPGWAWNWFDFSLVFLQLFEELVAAMGQQVLPQNFSFARVVRLMRLIRVIRLARILRLIHELRVLVKSISNSLRSLVWTVVLLGLLIYSVSLFITQLVAEAQLAEDFVRSDHEEIERHWGNLGRSMLSLFQAISGGVDWDMLVAPLMSDISPLLAVLFVLYIGFSTLAMMNVVTGIFVDSVLTSAKQDRNEFIFNNARELFAEVEDKELNLETFLLKMKDSSMLDFFKSIQLDPSEAEHLFGLLDMDDSGSIDADEFLTGCVRLKEPAKGLDTAYIVREMRKVDLKLRTVEANVEGQCRPASKARVSSAAESCPLGLDTPALA